METTFCFNTRFVADLLACLLDGCDNLEMLFTRDMVAVSDYLSNLA